MASRKGRVMGSKTFASGYTSAMAKIQKISFSGMERDILSPPKKKLAF
jgi:hypothetical protein